MRVPVVQIRHMRMTVDHRFVRVGMRVPMGGRQPRVHVIVVTVVVTMAVRVLHRLVGMLVLVARCQHEKEPEGDARTCRQLP